VPAFLATVERYNRLARIGCDTGPKLGKPLKCQGVRQRLPLRGADLPAARKNFGCVQTDLAMPRARQSFRADRRALCGGRRVAAWPAATSRPRALEGTISGPSNASGGASPAAWRAGPATAAAIVGKAEPDLILAEESPSRLRRSTQYPADI